MRCGGQQWPTFGYNIDVTNQKGVQVYLLTFFHLPGPSKRCVCLYQEIYANYTAMVKALSGDSDTVIGYSNFTRGLFFIPFQLRYPSMLLRKH